MTLILHENILDSSNIINNVFLDNLYEGKHDKLSLFFLKAIISDQT